VELDDLGQFRTLVPNWNVGDTFTRGDCRRFRILKIARVRAAGEAVVNAMWMVEPLAD
jgi:hypothetical protein